MTADPDYDPLLVPPMLDDELAEIRQRILDGARAYQQLGGMLPWSIHLQLSTDIPHLLGEVERLRAVVDGATVREEFGTRITWPDGKVEDRWCYRDRDDAAASAKHYADMIPFAAPDGRWHGAKATLIRRLHLTLPAEAVEEQR